MIQCNCPVDWYNFVGQGLDAIHSRNPNLLSVVGGVNYATDTSFRVQQAARPQRVLGQGRMGVPQLPVVVLVQQMRRPLVAARAEGGLPAHTEQELHRAALAERVRLEPGQPERG
ncbi:hypothetical protein C8Q74DRAFT_527170 [Fomes fomentarius]|nr:hypothetical protein C8Q74DRAFT_527170 [Fomes fomentarius]